MPEHSQPSLLGSLWRFRGMSIAIVIGMMLLTFLVTSQTSPGAVATATLGLRTPSSDNVLAPGVQGDASLGRYTAQRARFINSDATMDDVAERVGKADVTAVRKQLLVTASQTSNYITVKAEGDTAAEAVALAEAVVGAYRDQTTAQVAASTDAAVEAIQTQIDLTLQNAEGAGTTVSDSAATTISDLQAEIAALRTSQAIYGDGVEFVVIPDVDSAITRGLPIRPLALGVIVGLAIAMSLAWWRADRDQRVNRWQDAEAILHTPLLATEVQPAAAVVPAAPAELAKMPSRTYDLLWESVWERVPEGIIVVQPIGPGRTCDVTLNLAAAAAREDLRVLVIDAGMSEANTTIRLGQDQGLTGLRESLRAGEDWRRHVIDIKVPYRYNYEMLPTGPSSDEYVATSRVRACIDEWREAYDYIFIDAEALGSTPLSSKLTAAADAVVPVVGRGAQTPQLVEFRRQVEVLEATVIGFAFTEHSGLFRSARRAPAVHPGRDDAQPAETPVPATAS